MWLAVLMLIVGLVFLVWSADRFVQGSAATGQNIGISKLLIGLTIVSIGTSAPEIFVAIVDSVEGEPFLAIGNAIGSNICNIGLVLGVTAMVAPLPFVKSTLRTELPWLAGVTLITFVLLLNAHLGWIDGLILLGMLAVIMIWLIHSTRRLKRLPQPIEEELEEIPRMTTTKGLVWIGVGVVVLLASAHVVVGAAEEIAFRLDVSEQVIGLTVVAVGTSLPELAATLTAAVRGETDIAIGNVVGSNVLNILAVLSVPALIHPVDLPTVIVYRDYLVMVGFTLLLLLFAYGIGSKKIITRFEGMILFTAFIGFFFLLYSQQGI